MTRRPVVVFDVNETLSDMWPMADRFTQVGAPGDLAATWFATVLRDGFALAAIGTQEKFATIAEQNLRTALTPHELDRPLDAAVEHVLGGLSLLGVHPDVPAGIRMLRDAGFRLVTLTNGATSVGERLLGDAGLLDDLERLLSVEDAGIWKPAAGAYEYAARTCGVDVAELVLVAVHPWDIGGAVSAGAGAAWLNRSGLEYPTHFAAPTLTGASLTEVAQALVDGAAG